MDTFVIKEKAIPLDASWDVIVVGGGPAGCTSAIAAAREGAKTMLIEATGCLGGMGTSALVPAWCPFSDKEKIIYKGLAEKIFESSKKNLAHVKPDAMDWVPIEPEELKRIYDDMVTESGAVVLFNTMLSSVETDGNGNVEAILVSNKAGMTAYKAKVYIDCTGDADLSAWAGAEFQKGDSRGDLQPATHCFVLTNVDEHAYLNGPVLHPNNPNSPAYEIVKSGKYPEIPDVHLCNNLVGPKTVGFNAGHLWDVDNTNPESVTKALIKGRKLAAAFKEALAEYHPKAFANAYLVNTGSLIGIRETRRIMGDYVLTVEDYVEKRSFNDEICRNSYYLDIHVAKEEVEDFKERKMDGEERDKRYKKGESHGIPYRCLTPKGLHNVIVAGRSISCDRPIQGSVRVMPVCLAMGEAAGLAGALAAKMENVDVHGVDIKLLRKRLKEEGAYFL